MTRASEVSFTSVMTSLLIGAVMRLTTCKSTILKKIWLFHSENLTGFVLSARNSLDAASEYLRKIGGIVDDKGDQRGVHAVKLDPAEKQRRDVEHNKKLEHERRAADYPHHGLDQQPERSKARARAERHQQAKRDSGKQRYRKDYAVLAKALKKLLGYV